MNRALLILSLASLGACSSGGSLSTSDTFDARYVGAWRVLSPDDATTFSDYDFSDAGKLTLLRSVAHDVAVDPMQGASTVVGAASGGVCFFAASWFSTSETSLSVGSQCTDGVARQVALAFSADTDGVSRVSVQSVDGQADWMRPAAWQFQHCDEHPCD
jgi:hypothetical protein